MVLSLPSYQFCQLPRWVLFALALTFVSSAALAQDPAKQEEEEAGINQKRLEWFTRQRAYPFTSIPQALRLKAISEMDRMQPRAVSTKTRVRTATAAALSSTQWTSIGPQPIGTAPNQYTGRVNTLAIDPGNSNVVYLGSDGGGVWKTIDGGVTWNPLTDTQPSLTIRSIALAPSNSNIVYAATGYSSSGSEYGAGILKSVDGGSTWTQIGGPFVQGTYVQTVYSVAVQPGGSQVVLAAAASIYRSPDGGSTWTSVLSANYTQVMFDPSNASHAFAVGLTGIYQSFDGGQTWSPSNGIGANVLPLSQFSWITLAIAPSSPNTLYAAGRLSSTSAPAFYKSGDSGSNWTPIATPSNDVIDYWGWSLGVHPTNANILYAGSLSIHVSLDGGASWTNVSSNVHVDHHVQAFTPDGGKLYIGNDGGVWSTTNPSSKSPAWTNLNTTQSNALLYPGFSIHPTDVNTAFVGAQDNGTVRYGGTQSWAEVTCGDGGWTAIDYLQTQNVYASCQNIAVLKSTSNGNAGTFSFAQTGITTNDRVSFIPPLVMDPSTSQRLYFGTFRLYQTTNGAQQWTAISPALTNDAQYGTITTIATSASDPNTIYTGSTDGQVYVSSNALAGGGSSWANRSNGLPNRYVSQIAVHPQDPLTAYVAVSGYGTPHLWKTSNGGTSWTSIGGNLPDIPINDVLIDPDRVAVLYAATDIGVFQSFDSGASWLPLGTGLPRVVVSAVKLHRPTRTLRAVTYGRGAWDLWIPLSNQVTVTIASSAAGAPFQLEDGSTYQAPVTFSWTSGGQHTVTWLAGTVSKPGTRYVFQSWTDGGANPRTFTVPPANATYTATEKVQYLLAVSASPTAAGLLKALPTSTDGYYDAGTSVTLTATASAGYRFVLFTGDVSGGVSPLTTLMSVPRTVVANFACDYQFQGFVPSAVGPGLTSGLMAWTTGAGCSASVSSDSAWIVVGTAALTTGGAGTASFSIAANSASSTRAGRVTFSGSGGFTYSTRVTQDAAGSARPSIVSFSPNSGSGANQVFNLQVYDASGFGNLNWISATFSSPLNQAQCQVAVSPAPGTVYLYLLADNGGGYLGPVSLSGTGVLKNSSCTLSAPGSSFSGSGSNLNVGLSLSFTQAFSGDKYISAYASDVSGATAPSVVLGSWSVSLTPSTTLIPVSGAGSTQAFTFTFSDPLGYQDLAGAQMVINSALSTVNSCYILFARPDVVSLADDSGNHFTSTSLGAPAVLQNSQCSVLASLTSQLGSGTTVAFTVTVVFKAAFAGSKTVWSNVNNNAGISSGWQQLGTYIATGPQQGLTAQSVNPSAGLGQAQAFTFSSFDPQGAPDISGVQIVFNQTLSGVNGCYLLFAANNMVSLASDDGNSFTTAVLGRQTVLQNSQCSVFVGDSYQTQSGQNLSVTVFIAFKPAFAGVQNIYSSIQDNAGNRSSFPQLGTWTVPSTPPATSATLLNSQPLTGPSQALSFVFADPSSYTNVGTTQIMIHPTQSTTSSCVIGFNPSAGTIALTADSGSGVTTASLGQPLALENSQCIVNGAASSQFGSGNYLTLMLFVTMKASGSQNIYVSGNQAGTWNVTSPVAMVPVAVSPLTGAGAAGSSQSFTFTLSDPAGASDISGALIVLYPSLQGANACYILWGHGNNLISLASDNATTFTSATLGTPGLLQNSQCSVDPGSSFAVQTGNTVNLTVAVRFNAVYKQFNQIYAWVNVQNQAAALSGWGLLGRFSVQ